MTAREIIESSLRTIGVIASGETPSASDFSDSLQALNVLVDAWKNQKLLIISRKREEFDLIVNQNEYSIGATGDFVTSRPSEIFQINVKDQSGHEYELHSLNFQEWASISSKNGSSAMPTCFFLDYTPTNVTLKVFDTPTEARKIVIYSKKDAVEIINPDDDIELQPGLLRALKYNLAVELAPEFSRPLDPLILKIASDSIKDVKKNNVQPPKITSDVFGLTNRKSFNGRDA